MTKKEINYSFRMYYRVKKREIAKRKKEDERYCAMCGPVTVRNIKDYNK